MARYEIVVEIPVYVEAECLTDAEEIAAEMVAEWHDGTFTIAYTSDGSDDTR